MQIIAQEYSYTIRSKAIYRKPTQGCNDNSKEDWQRNQKEFVPLQKGGPSTALKPETEIDDEELELGLEDPTALQKVE